MVLAKALNLRQNNGPRLGARESEARAPESVSRYKGILELSTSKKRGRHVPRVIRTPRSFPSDPSRADRGEIEDVARSPFTKRKLNERVHRDSRDRSKKSTRRKSIWGTVEEFL
jgi:hypothetical protein